ncbi:FAD-dependent oxidoreductase [Chitinophaga alhagiae]|uniref:FAD-dependent oxidoreductase n=1 Tax=Chitinophaga alhagiae TaxID=2203219 RepID=UPI000E5C2EB0|nr:NAD(P)/FAD-dependent oxidoreductase [Chitinophaga alhagiae]
MGQKVIIIGAGVAGPVLGIQLQNAGYHVEIFEGREDAGLEDGAFLGLTPNGLNVLLRFVPETLLRQDCTTGSMRFYNQQGREIAALMTDYQRELYHCETIQLKRHRLNEAARLAASEKKVPVYFGKKCVCVVETEQEVTAWFSDGSSASADLLMGADGTFSAVRNSMFPGAARPVYNKNISTGGYARLPELSTPLDAIRMTFGERGFFAYNVSSKGEIWWFNNYYRAQEPSREEVRTVLKSEIKNELLRIHEQDDPLFSRIIRATDQVIAYPVYDIPKLAQWHTRRVCLVGDAAHATSPHIGQGASLALEDTECLAKCLGNATTPEAAFAAFQRLRQPRVEKIIKSARKVGNAKSKPGRVATWFRDRLIGFFIKAQIKKLHWIYGYRA